MPITSEFSYVRFDVARTLDDGVTSFDLHVPFGYAELEDNRLREVVDGDTLRSIAADEYRDLVAFDGLRSRRGEQLWQMLGEFQPVPIEDPTLLLEPGTTIVVPSANTVVNRIYDARRRKIGRIA